MIETGSLRDESHKAGASLILEIEGVRNVTFVVANHSSTQCVGLHPQGHHAHVPSPIITAMARATTVSGNTTVLAALPLEPR